MKTSSSTKDTLRLGRLSWALVLFLTAAPFVFSGDADAQTKGPTRIDFGDRVIQGQSNTTGAVYLLERKETAIKSMVRKRTSFRHLTIRTVYDR